MVPGRPGGVSERLRTLLGHVEAYLRIPGASWARLGFVLAPYWKRLGAPWARFGASWARLGLILARLGPSWAHLGRVLVLSWGRLGASWARLERILARLGHVLGASWAPYELQHKPVLVREREARS